MSTDPRFMAKNLEGRPDWWSSDHWSTPPHLVGALEREFGPFDLDACCTAATAKATRYYTPIDDGLAQPWDGNVWLNPPYSNIPPWLARAIEETTRPGGANLVVALLPASTDTRWFHRYVLPHAEVRFLLGRVRFLGWMGTPIPRPKSPSLYAIYRRGDRAPLQLEQEHR